MECWPITPASAHLPDRTNSKLEKASATCLGSTELIAVIACSSISCFSVSGKEEADRKLGNQICSVAALYSHLGGAPLGVAVLSWNFLELPLGVCVRRWEERLPAARTGD